MRVTLCEACGESRPEEFPMGWVFVHTVIGTTDSTGGFFGPHTKTEYDKHGFCSVACLAAYIALEGVHGETA